MVTDPTVTVTGSVNGFTWAYLVLRDDGVRRIFTVNENAGFAGMSAAEQADNSPPPSFTGHTLPAPRT